MLTQETSFSGIQRFTTRSRNGFAGSTYRNAEEPATRRVWSVGLLHGEEPYSIAITYCDSRSFADACTWEFLATHGGNCAKTAKRDDSDGACLE